MTMHNRHLLIASLLGLSVIVLDWLTKAWALSLAKNGMLPMEVTPFFNLVLVLNYGVSFGLFQANSLTGTVILALIAIIIILVLLAWLVRARDGSIFLKLYLGLAIGGAIGNVIDRVRYRAVVDFIDIHWQGYHWPAFNIADSAISTAMVGLFILILLKKA